MTIQSKDSACTEFSHPRLNLLSIEKFRLRLPPLPLSLLRPLRHPKHKPTVILRFVSDQNLRVIVPALFDSVVYFTFNAIPNVSQELMGMIGLWWVSSQGPLVTISLQIQDSSFILANHNWSEKVLTVIKEELTL